MTRSVTSPDLPDEPIEQLAAIEVDEKASVSEEVHATLDALLPWGVSVLFHAGLTLLAVFIVWSTVVGAEDEQVIVPTARLSAIPGAPLELQHTQRSRTLDRQREQRVMPRQQPTTLMARRVDQELKLVGVAGGANPLFGSASTPSAEFKTNFMGAGGNARDIIFVIDASGSLIDVFPFVQVELRKSIQRLSARQRFTVIFFQEMDAIEVPPAGLTQATPDQKQAIIDWLGPERRNITPTGKSNPQKAIELALRYQPDLIYMMSDDITGASRGGRFEIDQRRLIDDIEKLNTAGTKINTIQFLYPDPLAEFGRKATLELIAEQTGGVYKFVDKQDLNIE